MIPAFLLPENTIRDSGQGPEVALDGHPRQALLLTLGINSVLEQESLEVSVCGSCDGQTWVPVATFPPKSYCGTYFLDLDLARHPDLTRLRAHWKMNRWARGEQKPLFGFYLYVEEPRLRAAGAV